MLMIVDVCGFPLSENRIRSIYEYKKNDFFLLSVRFALPLQHEKASLYILMNTCYIYNKVKKTNSSGVSFSNQTKGFSKKQNKR